MNLEERIILRRELAGYDYILCSLGFATGVKLMQCESCLKDILVETSEHIWINSNCEEVSEYLDIPLMEHREFNSLEHYNWEFEKDCSVYCEDCFLELQEDE
jgi:hypothetical protein